MAGVAGGVADHLGVDVLWVRAAFVALTAVSGAGVVVAYGLLWVFVRQEDAGVARTLPRRERQQPAAWAQPPAPSDAAVHGWRVSAASTSASRRSSTCSRRKRLSCK